MQSTDLGLDFWVWSGYWRTRSEMWKHSTPGPWQFSLGLCCIFLLIPILLSAILDFVKKNKTKKTKTKKTKNKTKNHHHPPPKKKPQQKTTQQLPNQNCQIFFLAVRMVEMWASALVVCSGNQTRNQSVSVAMEQNGVLEVLCETSLPLPQPHFLPGVAQGNRKLCPLSCSFKRALY